MDHAFIEYLLPSRLCDFDCSPQIRQAATGLAVDVENRVAAARAISNQVRNFPYGIEDWDTRASDTLQKRWGMCSGKTNLLVALARSIGLPARYVVIRIKTELPLWEWVAGRDRDLALKMGYPSPEQDHVLAEIYTGSWEKFDVSRDPAFETGLKKLNISLERKPALGDPLILGSFDEWALKRQAARRFKEGRSEIFRLINLKFDEIRRLAIE